MKISENYEVCLPMYSNIQDAHFSKAMDNKKLGYDIFKKDSIARAKKELEAIYLGVPDESVNLTFKDFANNFQQNSAAERKTSSSTEEISTNNLTKSPSLDFSKALEATKDHERRIKEDELYREHLVRNNVKKNSKELKTLSPVVEKEARMRPGIPHSNICAVCSEHVYIFRTRCLVCGRVYCRNCLGVGMGEMSEGRKCIDCLGSRFSPRYIKRAGQVGCFRRYPSTVKQQELVWAEKGPRRTSGQRTHGSSTESRSINPVSATMPGTPKRFRPINDRSNNTPSFVASSTFSPNAHNFPF